MTVIVGCLLALVIVCSQVYSFKTKGSTAKEQTDKSSEDSNSATISVASFSLPSPVNVQINLDPHCLFEIVFEDVKEENFEILNSPRIPIASVVMTRQLKQEEATAAKDEKKKENKKY